MHSRATPPAKRGPGLPGQSRRPRIIHPSNHGAAAEPLYDTVADKPPQRHRRGEGGEPQTRIIRFDAANGDQEHRAPIEHRTLGQEPDEAKKPDEQHRAARHRERRTMAASGVRQQSATGRGQRNCADGNDANFGRERGRDRPGRGRGRAGEINGVEGLELLTAGQATPWSRSARPDGPCVSRERRLRQPRLHAGAARRDRGARRRGGRSARRSTARRRWPGGGFKVRTGGEDAGRADRAPAGRPRRASGPRPPRRGSRVSAGQIPRLHYGKGVYFRLNGQGAVRTPGLSAADRRRARHALSPRPGRPGALRPGPHFVDTQDYTSIPPAAAGFYDYVRHFWPGLPDGA